MILNHLARFLSHHSLRWFYKNPLVLGSENLPVNGPWLVVSNHPNQMVDVMACFEAIPRPLSLTGKSTLFQNPVLSFLLKAVGTLPLVRQQDARPGQIIDNKGSFQAIYNHWRHGGAVLLFPEGKGYQHPHMTSLKTGSARLCLYAAHEEGIKNIHIVPLGLQYEKKDTPRSRLVINIAPAISVDPWPAPTKEVIDKLTQEIYDRLESSTLNFVDEQEAATLLNMAEMMIWQEKPILSITDHTSSFDLIAKRSRLLSKIQREDKSRLQPSIERLAIIREKIKAHDLDPEHIYARTHWGPVFAFSLIALPTLAFHVLLAIISRLLHGPALEIALYQGRRFKTNDDPAMFTILTALLLIIATYGLFVLAGCLTSYHWLAFVPIVGPLVGFLDLAFRDRVARIKSRARNWWLLRQNPSLHNELKLSLAEWSKDTLFSIKSDSAV